MFVEVFGVVAVSSMVLFYALEERGPRYILLFAAACAAAAAYGAMIASWPFAAVEGVWSVLALRRYKRAKAGGRDGSDASR